MQEKLRIVYSDGILTIDGLLNDFPMKEEKKLIKKNYLKIRTIKLSINKIIQASCQLFFVDKYIFEKQKWNLILELRIQKCICSYNIYNLTQILQNSNPKLQILQIVDTILPLQSFKMIKRFDYSMLSEFFLDNNELGWQPMVCLSLLQMPKLQILKICKHFLSQKTTKLEIEEQKIQCLENGKNSNNYPYETNKICDKGMKFLLQAYLPQLRSLDLHKNNLTYRGLINLLKIDSQLVYLDACKTLLTEDYHSHAIWVKNFLQSNFENRLKNQFARAYF